MGAYTSRYGDRSPRRRATAVVLTIAAHLLLAWLLLHLGPSWTKPFDEPSLSTFDVAAPPGRVIAPPTIRRTTNARAAPGGASPATQATRSPIPSPVPAPPAAAPGPSMLALDFDLGKVPRRGTGEGDADGAGKGDSVAAYGPGAGPGGARLYDVEWQREPPNAALDAYLAGPVPPGSWALVACRTIEDFRVENCRMLDEAPLGSGFARALRQAAWQFRIRPPRIGGRSLIGGWVRICWDLRPDEQGRFRCKPRD